LKKGRNYRGEIEIIFMEDGLSGKGGWVERRGRMG